MSGAQEIDYDLLAQKIAGAIVEKQQDRMLTNVEVCERFGGISKVTLWRWTKDDSFPQPIKTGSTSMWTKSSIDNHFTNLQKDQPQKPN